MAFFHPKKNEKKNRPQFFSKTKMALSDTRLAGLICDANAFSSNSKKSGGGELQFVGGGGVGQESASLLFQMVVEQAHALRLANLDIVRWDDDARPIAFITNVDRANIGTLMWAGQALRSLIVNWPFRFTASNVFQECLDFVLYLLARDETRNIALDCVMILITNECIVDPPPSSTRFSSYMARLFERIPTSSPVLCGLIEIAGTDVEGLIILSLVRLLNDTEDALSMGRKRHNDGTWSTRNADSGRRAIASHVRRLKQTCNSNDEAISQLIFRAKLVETSLMRDDSHTEGFNSNKRVSFCV